MPLATALVDEDQCRGMIREKAIVLFGTQLEEVVEVVRADRHRDRREVPPGLVVSSEPVSVLG